jgi:hypothetical protein
MALHTDRLRLPVRARSMSGDARKRGVLRISPCQAWQRGQSRLPADTDPSLPTFHQTLKT